MADKKKRDSLGRERHENQSYGAKKKPEAGIGDGGSNLKCPSYLGGVGKNIWKTLKKRLADRDLLDAHDKEALEIFAAAYEEWRMARDDVMKNGFKITESGSNGFDVTKKNPSVDAMQDAWKRLKSMFGDLGIGPSARTKLTSGESGGDLLADILRGDD